MPEISNQKELIKHFEKICEENGGEIKHDTDKSGYTITICTVEDEEDFDKIEKKIKKEIFEPAIDLLSDTILELRYIGNYYGNIFRNDEGIEIEKTLKMTGFSY